MDSPTAMTEHVSLNLAWLFLLYAVHISSISITSLKLLLAEHVVVGDPRRRLPLVVGEEGPLPDWDGGGVESRWEEDASAAAIAMVISSLHVEMASNTVGPFTNSTPATVDVLLDGNMLNMPALI